MMAESCHDWRPSLAAWALGRLEGAEADAMAAHLAGCDGCRSEATELHEVASALRLAEPLRAEMPPRQPPPTLGEAVSARVAEARAEVRKRRARALLTTAAAVLAVAVAVAVVGWWPTEEEPERVMVDVSELAGGLEAEIEMADRGWGAWLNIVASGLEEGTAYGVWVEDRQGTRRSAGSFLGIGDDELSCYMATAMRLDEVATVGIDDPDGNPVLRGELPASRTARGP